LSVCCHADEVNCDDDQLLHRLSPPLRGRLSRDEVERQAKLLMAAKPFARRLFSSDGAAWRCGMERVAFLLALPEVGVSISNLGPADADDEVAFAIRA
jgi:hypothetical protein